MDCNASQCALTSLICVGLERGDEEERSTYIVAVQRRSTTSTSHQNGPVPFRYIFNAHFYCLPFIFLRG